MSVCRVLEEKGITEGKSFAVMIVGTVLFCVISVLLSNRHKDYTLLQGHKVDLSGLRIENEKINDKEVRLSVSSINPDNVISVDNLEELKTAIIEFTDFYDCKD